MHRCMSTGCNTSWERKGRGGQTPPDAQEVWHAEHCALDDSWWRGEVQLRAVRDGVTDREPGEADEASEESIVSVFARRMTRPALTVLFPMTLSVSKEEDSVKLRLQVEEMSPRGWCTTKMRASTNAATEEA